MADAQDVSYTVKELIGRLDVKMDVLMEKVDSKVDRIEDRVTQLEMDRTAFRSSLSTLRFIVLGALPVIAGLAHFIH